MQITTHIDAQAFLNHTQAALESNEAANGLMLGICARLALYPERITTPPCLKTIDDEHGLVLAAIQTPPYNLVVYGHRGDLDEGARALAADLVREEWQIPGVLGPSEMARLVAARLGEATGRGYRLERREQVYELRQVQTPVPTHGQLRVATESDAPLVSRWWYEFHLDIFGQADAEDTGRAAKQRIADGDVYVWDVGEPVSLAAKTRPTTKGISVGPVYTPPERRQRGYATACVSELSRLLLTAGREFCALFVDVANPVAARVYQRIGYRPLCDYDEYTFEIG